MNRDGGFAFANVSGGYGAMTIVHGLTADVPQGRCLCILGRNGVGKTTLVKILSGHLACREGKISLDGRALTELSADRRRRLGQSYAMQERPVFDRLSVRDNLLLMLPPNSLGVYRAYFEAFPILEQRLSQVAGTVSGGERKLLSFARAMAEGGMVTILDEPSEGVQAENIEKMKAFILARKRAGGCLVVVEQNLQLAEAIGDAFIVMDQGRAVLQGEAGEIRRESLLRHLEP